SRDTPPRRRRRGSASAEVARMLAARPAIRGATRFSDDRTASNLHRPMLEATTQQRLLYALLRWRDVACGPRPHRRQLTATATDPATSDAITYRSPIVRSPHTGGDRRMMPAEVTASGSATTSAGTTRHAIASPSTVATAAATRARSDRPRPSTW